LRVPQLRRRPPGGGRGVRPPPGGAAVPADGSVPGRQAARRGRSRVMIHVNRRSYPYMEEVNEGIVGEFRRLLPVTGKVLDVGCGRGQLGAAVRELGWEVWGVENSAQACVTARERLNGLVEADLHDVLAVRRGVGDQTFDAVIFSDVLEHVYDPRTVLENYLA